jgi:hypothetical protein
MVNGAVFVEGGIMSFNATVTRTGAAPAGSLLLYFYLSGPFEATAGSRGLVRKHRAERRARLICAARLSLRTLGLQVSVPSRCAARWSASSSTKTTRVNLYGPVAFSVLAASGV